MYDGVLTRRFLLGSVMSSELLSIGGKVAALAVFGAEEEGELSLSDWRCGRLCDSTDEALSGTESWKTVSCGEYVEPLGDKAADRCVGVAIVRPPHLER